MLETELFLTVNCRHRGLSCWFILGRNGPIRVSFQPADHRQAVRLLQERHGAATVSGHRPGELAEAAARLHRRFAAYLDGQRREFYQPPPSSPFLLAASSFQRRVWEEIAAIPYGETRSYGEIGAELGGKKLARAVGRACGANPCPLLIPCHRVVGANSLGGFTGGLAIKKMLLAIEQRRG